MNDTLATLEAMLRQACAEHAECLEAAVNFELAQEQAQGDLRNAECLEEDARARAKALGEAVAAYRLMMKEDQVEGGRFHFHPKAS